MHETCSQVPFGYYWINNMEGVKAIVMGRQRFANWGKQLNNSLWDRILIILDESLKLYELWVSYHLQIRCGRLLQDSKTTPRKRFQAMRRCDFENENPSHCAFPV
jgi:hypothetical protein